MAGVGTGGTVMGVGAFLRKHNSFVRIHPLEPLESPTMSVGKKVGSHRIQGISDEFPGPGLFEAPKLSLSGVFKFKCAVWIVKYQINH